MGPGEIPVAAGGHGSRDRVQDGRGGQSPHPGHSSHTLPSPEPEARVGQGANGSLRRGRQVPGSRARGGRHRAEDGATETQHAQTASSPGRLIVRAAGSKRSLCCFRPISVRLHPPHQGSLFSPTRQGAGQALRPWGSAPRTGLELQVASSLQQLPGVLPGTSVALPLAGPLAA